MRGMKEKVTHSDETWAIIRQVATRKLDVTGAQLRLWRFRGNVPADKQVEIIAKSDGLLSLRDFLPKGE